MEHLRVDDAEIEYEVEGSGEPVLLIPLSVIGDGLGRPLLAQPLLASRYRLIHYHRRGYMGSTLGTKPLTMAGQAADAAALLRHLGVEKAHVVGHSIGGLIALQLAADTPGIVHSLALLEPPLPMVPSAKTDNERVFLPMMNAYRGGDKRKAIELFGDAVFGPNWQYIAETAVPGSVEQAVRDVDTFIQELPGMRQWQFGPKEAAVITQPVLSVVGIHSKPIMQEGRSLLHAWFPQTEDCDLPTTHLLQMQNPQGMAQALAGFFSRHPMTQSPYLKGEFEMSTEDNKQLARRFVEEWNRGNREGVYAFFSPDFVAHNPQPGEEPNTEGTKRFLGWFFDAFPDSHLTLENLVAEGDLVAEQGILTGTHQGSFLGIPPTGKKVRVAYFDVHRFKDGKIIEGWHLEDTAGLLRQIGAMPAPKPAID